MRPGHVAFQARGIVEPPRPWHCELTDDARRQQEQARLSHRFTSISATPPPMLLCPTLAVVPHHGGPRSRSSANTLALVAPPGALVHLGAVAMRQQSYAIGLSLRRPSLRELYANLLQ